MSYINKNKRDILLFPHFPNIEKIENIRIQYDELANILPSHITIVHPFDNDISNEELNNKINKILLEYHPFPIKCHGISYHKDELINKYYIYLDIIEGQDIINEISKKIYHEILNINQPSWYIPHITLGTVDKIPNLSLNGEFNTTIDNIQIELVGENEESNIISIIKLN